MATDFLEDLKYFKEDTNANDYEPLANVGLCFPGWQKGEMTEEHKKNLSLSAKKRKRTAEHIAKLHEGRRNSKNSPEHLEAIKKHMTGYKHSEETRKKISEKIMNNSKDNKKRASNAGKISGQKRKESGFYQTEEYSNSCKKGWNTRRARLALQAKGGMVYGD